MHLVIACAALGVPLGWIWKRCHRAFQDWRESITRMKNARAGFWAEARTTAVTAVIVIVALRLLL